MKKPLSRRGTRFNLHLQTSWIDTKIEKILE